LKEKKKQEWKLDAIIRVPVACEGINGNELY
jgi:hypothetical protein